MDIPKEEIAQNRAHAEKIKAGVEPPAGFSWQESGQVKAGDLFMDANGSFHPIAEHHVGQTVGEFYAIVRKA